MTQPTTSDEDEFQITYEKVAPHSLCCAHCKRSRDLLKLIAETPEPKDTIQVWAWNAYEKGAPDAQ